MVAALKPAAHSPSAMHLPSLLAALVIMLAGTIYPPLLARTNGTVDHGLLMALFWAMSAGLVRGVGFVPRAFVWKLLFSGWSCAAALLLAAGLRWIV